MSFNYTKTIFILVLSIFFGLHCNGQGANETDSVKLVAAGEEYQASKSRKRTLGRHYRESWTTPVHLKYLDLSKYNGGLSIVTSIDSNLILKDKTGRFYRFSLINKNPYNLLPKGFEATFPEDILKDQTSTSHPFGAVVVDFMAKKAKIPYAEAQAFYLPETHLSGWYLTHFGGKAGILENHIPVQSLLNTDELYQELQKNPKAKVNQHEFLKSRLFDLLIGDYNRGDHQWFWRIEQQDEATYFYPIPKTRKNYFTKINGLLPSILKGLAPEVQHFDYIIKKPEKLSIAARNLDRNLLNSLHKEDWLSIAKELQNNLTDDVIIDAVKLMPKEVFDIDGKEIINKLISRKNNIHHTALDYYRVLSKNVKITTTNNNDILFINRSTDSTSLIINSPNRNHIFYERLFDNNETKSISLYTLAGKDSLTISGRSDSPIRIRFIGGEDEDFVLNQSENHNIFYYDNKDGNYSGNKGKIFLSDKNWINLYNSNDFEYNTSGFSPYGNIYNAKDFISIGLLHTIKNHGFRKTPYAFDQKISGIIAPKTGAFELKYLSSFYSLFGRNYDLVLTGRYMGPAYDFNFFGIGNSTANIHDVDYYRIRSKTAFFNTYLQRRFSDKIKAGIGPGVEYINILSHHNPSFLFDEVNLQQATYDWFFKYSTYLDFDYRDQSLIPKRGWRWTSSATYNHQINTSKFNHLKLYTDFSSYYTSTRFTPLTFAFRAGASTNIGSYQFFHASTIGNYKNLRGFRAQRFSGRSAVYANAEARLKITKIRTYLISGDCGVYAFFDTGKVKSEESESNEWHKGYGPGIWINLFDNLVISLGSGFSKEGMVFSFDTGFRF